jgi:hypothetical protein
MEGTYARSKCYKLHFKVQVNRKITGTGPRNVDAEVLVYVLHGVTGSAHVQGRKGAFNVSDLKASKDVIRGTQNCMACMQLRTDGSKDNLHSLLRSKG